MMGSPGCIMGSVNPGHPAMKPFLLTALVLALLPVGGAAASEERSARHPCFDDRGALPWSTKLADAQKSALKAGKLMFIVYGREDCPLCRALVERTLPSDRVKARLAALVVGLAADCDAPEKEVQDLLRANLKGSTALPFVAFVTPDLQWVAGASGGWDADGFLKVLDVAEKSPLRYATEEARRKLGVLAERAEKAAGKGDWKGVVESGREGAGIHGRCPERLRLEGFVKKARGWAEAELSRVLEEVRRGGDLPAARLALGEVKKQMAGESESADAEAGLKALQKLGTLRSIEVDPRGIDPMAMREKAAREFASSRWRKVFDDVPPAGEKPPEDAPPKDAGQGRSGE